MDYKDWLKTDIGRNIWLDKYRADNESFDQWLNRISAGDTVLKEQIIKKEFLFAGRILANRGLDQRGKKITLGNCFVLNPPEDNLASIFNTARDMAIVYSRGGGVGLDISRLRPRGSEVNNSAKTTTGACSFMELYSFTTSLIGQNGRRGALMLSLDCSHPDLVEFISIKEDLQKIKSANISIRISDDFMNAVRTRQNWTLNFTVKDTGEVIRRVVNAYELFKKLTYNNWEMGEPGMLFWDTISDYHILSEYPDFEHAGTNPCGEQPLPAGGSCNLGSINLAAFVENSFTEKAFFNVEKFKETVRNAVYYMHDVLMEGIPLMPLPYQSEAVNNYRQIGLGPMGVGDTFVQLGIAYDSKEAIEWSRENAKIMADAALYASAEIARDFEPFPLYHEEYVLNSPFVLENASRETLEMIKLHGLAHSQLLTCAPTGSISTMLGISGGIEPIFAISYNRETKSLHGQSVTYKVFTPVIKELMSAIDIQEEADLPKYCVTAHTINHEKRIAMQKAWQEHIDASISSTINLPESATPEDVEQLYMMAWQEGLKGITVFRDGGTRKGILTLGEAIRQYTDINDKVYEVDSEEELPWGTTLKVSDRLVGYKRKIETDIGAIHVHTWFIPDTGETREIWLSENYNPSYSQLVIALGRILSAGLRTGLSFNYILAQFRSVAINDDNAITRKIADALQEMREDFVKTYGITEEIEKVDKPTFNINISESKGKMCPSCGEAELQMKGGCFECPVCGNGGCSI